MNDKWLDGLSDVFTSLLNTEHDLETLDNDAPYCPDPLTCGGACNRYFRFIKSVNNQHQKKKTNSESTYGCGAFG